MQAASAPRSRAGPTGSGVTGRRRLAQAVFVAFVLVVGAHLVVLARLALAAGPDGILLSLLVCAALFGTGALALAWGGLVRGQRAALIVALAALALYSAAAFLVAFFPNSDSVSPGDDPLPRVALYLAALWALAVIGGAASPRSAQSPQNQSPN